MRSLRSYVLGLLTAALLLFGPAVAADPAPDGPGYVLPTDTSDAPVSMSSTDTAVFYASADFSDPSGSSGLPELMLAVDLESNADSWPGAVHRSSHIEPGTGLVATRDHVPRE